MDGGWPTFCRGWGKLPFDRSSNDISAHAIRALHACREYAGICHKKPLLTQRIQQATQLGQKYLEQNQQEDGSWLPLWFGNEGHPQESNPVYGTSKVLTMYDELRQTKAPQAVRAANWLVKNQHASGGWGPPVTKKSPNKNKNKSPESDNGCSVEETSLALTALMPYAADDPQIANAVELGLSWLTEAVENGGHLQPAPIGFYFAKLWYHERLYPQLFAVQALDSACHHFRLKAEPMIASHTS